MTGAETGSYLRHHLALAGRSDTLFSDDATALIHQTSRGYPRAVNTSPSTPWSPRSPPTRHRRRKRRPHRDQPRKRRGLNPIRVNPTNTALT